MRVKLDDAAIYRAAGVRLPGTYFGNAAIAVPSDLQHPAANLEMGGQPAVDLNESTCFANRCIRIIRGQHHGPVGRLFRYFKHNGTRGKVGVFAAGAAAE